MNQPDIARKGADGLAVKNFLAGARRIASLNPETFISGDEPLSHPPVCLENPRLAGAGVVPT